MVTLGAGQPRFTDRQRVTVVEPLRRRTGVIPRGHRLRLPVYRAVLAGLVGPHDEEMERRDAGVDAPLGRGLYDDPAIGEQPVQMVHQRTRVRGQIMIRTTRPAFEDRHSRHDGKSVRPVGHHIECQCRHSGAP